MKKRLAAAFVVCAASGASADTIRVAAAISMEDALADVARSFETKAGDHVEFSLGSSGQLMSQIRNGADVDVFVSAASRQMDELAKDKLVDAATRRDVVANALVLIVPAGVTNGPTSFADLATDKTTKLAVGEPKTVPAGAYAQQTLKSLKLDAAVASKLVYGTNVRQVLSYVERGEASAGLVYATDARQSGEKVHVVATAPADSHEPIVYPAAIIATTKHHEAAGRLLDYVVTADARQTFAKYGFTTPATQPAAAR